MVTPEPAQPRFPKDESSLPLHNRFTGLLDEVDDTRNDGENHPTETPTDHAGKRNKKRKLDWDTATSNKQGNNNQNSLSANDHHTLDRSHSFSSFPSSKLAPTINISSLQPEKLIILNVSIGNNSYRALIDSGATNSLVKSCVLSQNNIAKFSNRSVLINGLGDSSVITRGCAKISFRFSALSLESNFDTVDDNAIEYDFILGIDFLKRYRVSVDVKKRLISMHNSDGSKHCSYLDECNNVIRTVFEGVPIFAREDTKLSKDGVTVPVMFNQSCASDNIYYESKSDNNMCGLDGIMSISDNVTPVVLFHSANDKSCVIRKGQILGRVSTLVESEQEEQPGNSLTFEDLCSRITLDDHISDEQKQLIFAMLNNTQNAFSKDDSDIGEAKVAPHTIELSNKTPIWQKPRQFPTPINKEIDKQCSDLLSNDIIEYSNSRWSSPIVPVRKRDGSLRMCVDYRKLNSVTKTDNFPMPNLSEAIYGAHNAKFFSKLDLIRGYYQIPVEEQSRQYTAFSTAHNHYQFKRLSFGLKNSGIAFQKCMQQILSDFCFNNVIVYIDDILIMSRTFEEHLDLVGKILHTLMSNGIKVKIDKCELFKRSVQFLGHLIGETGIRKSPEFIQKIIDYPKPKTVTDLRKFLGLINFQRKFVNNCSSIAKPLSCVTNGPKKKVLIWSDEMNESFDQLKSALAEEVSLSFPDYSDNASKLELFVDASGTGAGGCLQQWQCDSYKTIGYSSMTFTTAQRKYSTIERELAAIRWGIKSFRAFLFGVSFILYTDHKPLLYLHNMAKDNSRMMRTLNDLADFDFTIRYKPGKENTAADAMSRIVNESVHEETDELTNSNVLPAGLRILKTVEGGGNSLFIAVHECLEIQKDNFDNVPSNHLELRRQIVDTCLQSPKKYGIRDDKDHIKRIRNMRCEGILPCEELFNVICSIFKVQIWVHHGTKWPVIYKCDSINDLPKLHLQCISGIHFNPLFACKDSLSVSIAKKNINQVVNCDAVTEINHNHLEVSTCDIEPVRDCDHARLPSASCVIELFSYKFCALLDTGAQISLISSKVFHLIKGRNPNLQLIDVTNQTIGGINNSETSIIGVINLKPTIFDLPLTQETPFAVVKAVDLPCCCILGANFLSQCDVIVDFCDNVLKVNGKDSVVKIFTLISKSDICNSMYHRYNVSRFVGELFLNDVVSDSVSDDDEYRANVRYLISNEELQNYQNSDQILSTLKDNIVQKIPAKDWPENLQPFKFLKDMRVCNDLLLVDKYDVSVPIVPFSLLIEIVHKVHVKLAHIGKRKLVNLIRQKFYHPHLAKVAADLCLSCQHCQLYKISSQPISPPIIKIQANFPFDLLALDLLQFPKSRNHNVAVLVAVDHFSKFLFAVPMKDKKSSSVCRILQNQIFPHILRLPVRILTDNGPEFRSSDFNNLLDQYSITHIYSTRYKASGNGAVERTNRTITEFLKGLINDQLDWDDKINQAVIVYNSTFHVEIKDTPANFILKNPHDCTANIPIDSDSLKFWKESHPNFESFAIGDKVVQKIHKIGNSLQYKLGKKFTGPYEITKIQSNGVSYEISDTNGNIFKVHHKQIKR